MNILFFLTPKSEVAYVNNTYSMRQAIEKMEYHKYTAVPILDNRGHYVGTLTEGDLLREIKAEYDLNFHEAENIPISKVPLRWKMKPVNINSNIEDLIKTAANQNFVPVVDDEGVFIGIITRKAIIQYGFDRYRSAEDAVQAGEKAGKET